MIHLFETIMLILLNVWTDAIAQLQFKCTLPYPVCNGNYQTCYWDISFDIWDCINPFMPTKMAVIFRCNFDVLYRNSCVWTELIAHCLITNNPVLVYITVAWFISTYMRYSLPVCWYRIQNCLTCLTVWIVRNPGRTQMMLTELNAKSANFLYYTLQIRFWYMRWGRVENDRHWHS